MSAPDTNTKTEEKKHRHALLGIRASLAYGAILLLLFIGWNFLASGEDEGAVDSEAGSSITDGDTEASNLEGYDAENYEPGGNSTGSVSGNPDEMDAPEPGGNGETDTQ